MTDWYRVRYTATLRNGDPVEGIVDVLAESDISVGSWSTFRAIRKHAPGINLFEAIELFPMGESDGSLATNSDPRDTTSEEVISTIVVEKRSQENPTEGNA
jgi:hypothetical protein